jgi:hypothetical protein
MNENMKTSSIVVDTVQTPKPNQLQSPTWLILIILVIALVVLKSFIYIKDGDRHGK